MTDEEGGKLGPISHSGKTRGIASGKARGQSKLALAKNTVVLSGLYIQCLFMHESHVASTPLQHAWLC
jgi:hypothetical protein